MREPLQLLDAAGGGHHHPRRQQLRRGARRLGPHATAAAAAPLLTPPMILSSHTRQAGGRAVFRAEEAARSSATPGKVMRGRGAGRPGSYPAGARQNGFGRGTVAPIVPRRGEGARRSRRGTLRDPTWGRGGGRWRGAGRGQLGSLVVVDSLSLPPIWSRAVGGWRTGGSSSSQSAKGQRRGAILLSARASSWTISIQAVAPWRSRPDVPFRTVQAYLWIEVPHDIYCWEHRAGQIYSSF